MAAFSYHMRLKAKADKSDMIEEIETRIQPTKDTVREIELSNMSTEKGLEGIDKSLEEIKELIKEKDKKNEKNFTKIYDKLDSKQDK